MTRARVKRFALVTIALLLLASVAGCGGGSGSSSPTPSPTPAPVPQSITVVPVIPTIAAGTTQQLVAIAHFANHTSAIVTQFATWTSSASHIASVGDSLGSKGLVSGASAGNAEVTAQLSGVSSSTTVTVTGATLTSITVIPPTPTIPAGAIVALTAVGNFSDGTTQDLTTSAVWSSSNAGAATVGNSHGDKGELAAHAVGSATITAADLGTSGSAGVTIRPPSLVALTIEPPETSLAVDSTQQLIAIGTYSDDSTQDLTTSVKWKSSDPNIAQVGKNKGEEGLVRAKKVGNTTISASDSGLEATAAVTVSPPTLTSISVTPPHAAVASGTSVQFTATGVFSDGTTQDLTRTVSWTSSDPANAVVSGAPGSQGLVTGIAVGSATITAGQDGVSGTSSVAVTPPTLVSISITPAFISLANGTTQQLTATGNFSDGTTQDITNSASWISLSPLIATVSSAPGSKGLVTGLSVGGATIRVTQAGVSDTTSVIVTPATLVAIAITPANPSIAKGTLGRLVATGVFTDHTTQNLTRSVSWTSSSRAVAIAGNHFPFQGAVFGRGEGSVTITATQGGISGTAALTVTPATLASITITPPHPSIANGTSLQLTATGTFSDRTTQNLTASVSWTSSDPEDAVVSNADGSQGLVTGTGVGSARITATQGGVSGTASVTVTPATLSSITITPPNPAIAKGTTKQLTATGTFTDGTTQDLTSEVSWTSSDQTIAEVDNALRNQGLVSGIAVGTATISAREDGVTGTTAVTVTPAALTSITITPPNSSVAKGTSQQLNASGAFTDGTVQDLTRFVSWVSSDATIAQVSNAEGSQGRVTGIGTGMVTITASLAGISGTTAVTVTPATLVSITITPPNPSIAKGTTQQLTATGVFTDATTQDLTRAVGWTSSDESIALVDNAARNQGLVSGIGRGTAMITATVGGVSGTTAVTVTPAALTSIAITPPDPSVAKGTSQQLNASGAFTDGTVQDLTRFVSWVSSDATVAQVSSAAGSKGLVTGIGIGTATITASLAGTSGVARVTVTPATLVSITIMPPNPSISNGTSVQMTATGAFTDGTTEDLTHSVNWSAIPASSLAIDTSGLLTGTAVGTGTIFAVQGAVVGQTSATVTPVVLTSIAITPANPSLPQGATLQLTATGTFSNGSTQDLTTAVSWSVSPPSLATVDANGLLTGVGLGAGLIRASFTQGGLITQGTTHLAVTPVALTAIAMTPTNPTIANGTGVLLAATCNFSDGTTQDCTNQANWVSSSDATAVVTNVDGFKGLVFALAPGSVTITATVKGVSGSTPVTISSATLNSITLTPTNPTVTAGFVILMKATGSFSDGSTQDLTAVADWSSSNLSVAQVFTNSVSSNGIVLTFQAGTATITATLLGVHGSTLVTVQ